MRTQIVAACVTVLLPWTCLAQESDEGRASKSDATLSEVVVTGEFPGPGLWKVSKPAEDGEHTLWILGEPSPIPATITWRSREVEKVMADSQELIGRPSLGIGFGEKVAVLRMLTLVPSILKARKNPHGQRLQEIVSGETYERWLTQKAKYIGRDSGIERWRPVFAADKLEEEARKKTGGTLANSMWAVIRRIAKEHKIKTTSPSVFIVIPKAKMKPLLKQFLETPLQDVECFAATIAMVEALSNADTVHRYGMAWATGDLQALRELPGFPNPKSHCDAALMNSQTIKELGHANADDIAVNLGQQWFDAVDAALATNRSTLAVLPIAELLNPEGRLSVLRAKGYVIQEPSPSEAIPSASN